MTQLTVQEQHVTGDTSLIDPLQAIQGANIAESTRRKYTRALERYLEIGILTDSQAVIAYADTLTNSGKKIFKAALRVWQKATINLLNANVTPDTIKDVEAIDRRFGAVQASIKTKTAKGRKAHTWLSKEQVIDLLSKPDMTTIKGMRDKVVLGLAVGCGLRRSEIASVRFQDIITQPINGKPIRVLQVMGKGAKERIVPLPSWLQPILAEWKQKIAKTGYIARSVDRYGNVQDSISGVSVYRIVAEYGKMIELPELAAHDMRRTFAQMVYERTKDLVVAQKLLGHENIETTRKYLELDTASLADAVEWL